MISTIIIFYFILTFIKVIQTWKWEREWTSYSFSCTKHPLIIFKRIYWKFQIYFVYNKKIFLFILLKKRMNFYNFIKKKKSFNLISIYKGINFFTNFIYEHICNPILLKIKFYNFNLQIPFLLQKYLRLLSTKITFNLSLIKEIEFFF